MSENNVECDDFWSRVQLAKLDRSDFLKPSMRLEFLDSASPDEVLLMQVDNEMLKMMEEDKK